MSLFGHLKLNIFKSKPIMKVIKKKENPRKEGIKNRTDSCSLAEMLWWIQANFEPIWNELEKVISPLPIQQRQSLVRHQIHTQSDFRTSSSSQVMNDPMINTLKIPDTSHKDLKWLLRFSIHLILWDVITLLCGTKSCDEK